MTGTAKTGKLRIHRPATALVVALTGIILGSNALAAGSSRLLCDKRLTDLKSLDVALEALVVDSVDHVPAEPGLATTDSLAPSDAAVNNITPLISISSQVESLLNRVFAIESDPLEAIPGKQERQHFSGHPGISPSRQNGNSAPVAAEVDQELSLDEEIESGALRRQMFRKDI